MLLERYWEKVCIINIHVLNFIRSLRKSFFGNSQTNQSLESDESNQEVIRRLGRKALNAARSINTIDNGPSKYFESL